MGTDRSRTEQEMVRPPLTELILARLGRPRWLWITIWSLLALTSPILFGTAIRLSDIPFERDDFLNLLLTQAVLAYACFVLLWGVGILSRKAAAVRDELTRLAPSAAGTLFQGTADVRAPLLLTAIVTAIVSAGGWAMYGPLPPLAALPFLFAYVLPILTFVWVYLSVLVDLDRFGRGPLALEVFPEDRSLGLGAVGSLASTGLGLLATATVPVLIAASDEPVTLGISLAIVAMTVLIFVLSMWHLHQQMAAAKERFVAAARQMYREAYEPIRRTPSTAGLEAHASVLSAAAMLDQRAQSLLTWPIDEGTVRFIVVVITGVVTSLIVKGLLETLQL